MSVFGLGLFDQNKSKNRVLEQVYPVFNPRRRLFLGCRRRLSREAGGAELKAVYIPESIRGGESFSSGLRPPVLPG